MRLRRPSQRCHRRVRAQFVEIEHRSTIDGHPEGRLVKAFEPVIDSRVFSIDSEVAESEPISYRVVGESLDDRTP